MADDLEPRVADLERRVGILESNFKNLADRVYALETAEPPETSEPPETTEPPPETTEPPPSSGGDKTLQQLVDPGGMVTLPQELYTEFCTVNQPTQIVGQPTTIDVTGITLANQKGIFDAQQDLEISDLTLRGARVPDANGAGIRGAIGAAITMTDCEVTECQMGILMSGGSDISIDNCSFYNNGTGGQGGLGHEIYCSAVSRSQYGPTNFTLTNSTIEGGNNTCIALKVRATSIVVQGCTIRGSTSTNPDSTGRVVDLPDGGEVLIEDTLIELQATSPTGSILGYLTENANQGAGTVTLRRVTISDKRNRGGELWARSGVGAKLVLEDCTYTAQNPPSLTGWDSVMGKFEL